MNDWIDDEVLAAARERLNLPPVHWEDYASGSPNENTDIIRAPEPWERPGGGGHIINALAKFTGLQPIIDWAQGWDVKPTWIQDLLPDIVSNLPQEKLASWLGPAAIGAVKWGQRVIPNMFVYRGMRQPSWELEWWEDLLSKAHNIRHPPEKSATLVTPKFLGTAAPEGLLLHGDVGRMKAGGIADIYSQYETAADMFRSGDLVGAVDRIMRAKEAARQRPAAEVFGLAKEFDDYARTGMHGMTTRYDIKNDFFKPRGIIYDPQTETYGMAMRVSDEALQNLPKNKEERLRILLWGSPTAGPSPLVPAHIRDYAGINSNLREEIAKALGIVDESPVGIFTAVDLPGRMERYSQAGDKVFGLLDANRRPRYYGSARPGFLAPLSETTPEEFLQSQARRFSLPVRGPTGFYNEVVDEFGRDVADRLAGVRINPRDPNRDLLRFAEKHDLPLYVWPYSAEPLLTYKALENLPESRLDKIARTMAEEGWGDVSVDQLLKMASEHPAEPLPEVAINAVRELRRKPWIDLMTTGDPVGGEWKKISRKIPTNYRSIEKMVDEQLASYPKYMSTDVITSAEYPRRGYRYGYSGAAFPHE